MLPIVGIVLTVAFGVWLELPSLWRNDMRREAGVYVLLLAFGTTLIIMIASGMQLPNPLHWIAFAYKPVSQALIQLLS